MKNMLSFCFFALFFGFPLLAFQEPVAEVYVDEYGDEFGTGSQFARISFTEKNNEVFREDGEREELNTNTPIVAGDFLESGHGRYAEIQFIDGTLLQIDGTSQVELQAINQVYDRESITIIKLHKGRVFLHVNEHDQSGLDYVYRLDTKSGTAYIGSPGLYQVQIRAGHMEVKTYRGSAELSGTQDSTLIRSGYFSSIVNMYRPYRPKPFNSFYMDSFERWAYGRNPYGPGAGSAYTDPAIANYVHELDDHGNWQWQGELGLHVWVPSVSVAWRPYSHGYWSRTLGSMHWVSYDPFGWVTHHYGRWGWSVRLGWYWIPRAHYSPGWVAWCWNDGYLGWSPLGIHGRPYYYASRTTININIFNHHHHQRHWNWVGLAQVRSNSYHYRPGHRNPKGQRIITTRPLYLDRAELESGDRVAHVIRDPQENRSRATRYVASRPSMSVAERPQGNRSAVPLVSRDTGTAAVSRYQQSNQSGTQRRVGPQAQGTERYQADQGQAVPGRRVQGDSSAPSRRQETGASTSGSNYRGSDRSVTQSGRENAPSRSESASPRSQSRSTNRESGSATPSRRLESTKPPASSRGSQATPPKRKEDTPSVNQNQSRSNRGQSSNAPTRRNETRVNQDSRSQSNSAAAQGRSLNRSSSGRSENVAPSSRSRSSETPQRASTTTKSSRKSAPAPKKNRSSESSKRGNN